MMEARRRAQELAAPYRGRRGMRMTLSSWVMTGGVVATVAGIFTFMPWLVAVGGILFAAGLVMAVIEAILEARR
jgi:divalent metal cation (Fe/Co/Zn/Cd) transporter